ncbi:hypothetical protein [Leifsonia sp. NPDC080035]|uniref:Uncharacterized protein n=1 Tax=Leifsonia sp. NPDC080035 TaxID=3143936 RepID=A0AAU7GFA7_9MICO
MSDEPVRIHPVLGRDAAVVLVVGGTLIGATAGFLHLIDFELESDTGGQLLSPQLFFYGPAAAFVGLLAGTAQYLWFLRARRPERLWWRYAGGFVSAFLVAAAGFGAVWLTTPPTTLGGLSDPLSALLTSAALQVVTARSIRSHRNVESRGPRSTSG